MILFLVNNEYQTTEKIFKKKKIVEGKRVIDHEEREERQTERASWACWHCDRLSAVPPLEQKERTASDSSGHASATRHSANALFRCRHTDSLAGPDATRLWHSHSALCSLPQPPFVASPCIAFPCSNCWRWIHLRLLIDVLFIIYLNILFLF